MLHLHHVTWAYGIAESKSADIDQNEPWRSGCDCYVDAWIVCMKGQEWVPLVAEIGRAMFWLRCERSVSATLHLATPGQKGTEHLHMHSRKFTISIGHGSGPIR